MKHGMFNRVAVIAACVFGLPQVAAADAFDAISCNKGREQGHPSHVSLCRVTVPNGNFAGAPPPVGTETGSHRHPWEPTFTWLPGMPRPEHVIGNHLIPWAFHGNGAPSYPKKVNATPGVVLSKPGDAVFQWIAVPAHDGTQSKGTQYLVRVSYAPYGIKGSVGLGMRLIVADETTEHVSEEFETTTTGTANNSPATFEAEVFVPAHTRITQLGVAVGKAGDASPLVIHDVAVVEMTFPYVDTDF